MRKSLFAFLILLFGSMSVKGQTPGDETGNWFMYFGLNRLSKRFSVHTEAQMRMFKLATDPEQLLLRTGLNYHTPKGGMVTGGYAHIITWPFEEDNSDLILREHRLWQQWIMTNLIGRFKFEHRYRLEQRWVKPDAADEWTYSNRTRYRIMLFIPLNKRLIQPGTVFIGIYDEVFLDLTRDVFGQNRLYGAVGYQIRKSLGVQAGYLNQYVSGEGRHRFQLAVFFNPDFR